MKSLLLIILMFIFLSSPVLAAERDLSLWSEDYEINGEELFNSTARDITSGKLSLSPAGIINRLFSDIFDEITGTRAMLKSILLVASAAGVLRILSDSFGTSGTNEAAFFACFLMITATSMQVFSQVVGYGAEVIHSLCGFITKFEPIFIGLLVSGGAVTQAAAFQPILTASVYILSLAVDKIILPLTYFSAILGIVNSIGSRLEIGTLNKLIRSLSKWVLTGVLTLFSAILTLYGFGTSALNNVATKGIKFAVGSFVPVVGGILSDTIDTVLSGAGLLKNAVGTAGMISVITIAAAPIVKIWVMLLLLRLSAAVIEPFSDKRITTVLSATADAASAIFSMVITAAMLFIISIGIILASTGVSL